jgi:lysophospholipase L1-like esterase
VKNHGVSGEDAEEMLARLDRVITEKPDLIVWQVGTNAILDRVDRAHDLAASQDLIPLAALMSIVPLFRNESVRPIVGYGGRPGAAENEQNRHIWR